MCYSRQASYSSQSQTPVSHNTQTFPPPKLSTTLDSIPFFIYILFQGFSGSTSAVTMAMQEPQNNVSTMGGLVFQSLFEAKDDSPGSPGSATSSSTLVNPQSRKVSPTAIKDFAYPPSNDNHVLDPVAIIEENRARNETLDAKLRSAIANLQGNSQAQLAMTRANATTVSNVVLRQLVQDLCKELSRARNLIRTQGIESQGETGFFEKYGVDSAVLSRLVGSGTPMVQKDSKKKSTDEVLQAEEALDQVKEHKTGSGADEFDLATLQDSQQPRTDEDSSTDDDTEEEYIGNDDPVAEETADEDGTSESSGEDQELKLDDEISPPICEEPISMSDGNEDTAAQEPATEDRDYVQGVGSSHEGFADQSFEFPEPAGPATLWTILQSNQCGNENEKQPIADEEAAGVLPTTVPIPDHDEDQDVGHSHGYFVDQSFEFSEPAGPATLWTILQSNQCENEVEDAADTHEEAAGISEVPGSAILPSSQSEDALEEQPFAGEEVADAEPTTESIPDHNDDQDVGDSHGYFVNQSFESSEAAGPANLWGILESDQVEDKAVAVEEAGAEEVAIEEVAIEEAAVEEGAVEEGAVEEGAVEEGAVEEGAVEERAVEEAAGSPEAEVSEAELPGVEVPEADAEAEVPGPANLCGISKSHHQSSEADSRDEEFGEQAQVEGNTVPDESESNGVAGVQEFQDQEDGELVGLPEEVYSPDFNGDSNELHDVSDNGEEGMETPTTLVATTVEEVAAPSPHGSIDGDNVAVQEVGIQDVAVEETVDVIGSGASEITLEAVTEPVSDLEVVEGEDHEAQNGAVQAVELQGPVDTVGTNTPIVVIDDVVETLEDATVAEGAASDEENSAQEGEKAEGPVVFGNVGVIREEFTDSEDHEPCSVELGGPSTSVVEDGKATSGVVVHAQPADPPLPPSPSSSHHVRTFDFAPSVPQPKALTKGQKRNLERKRAAVKKKDEAAEKRRLAEEAAKTPEALAQRQAEADVTLGERRLRLQAARMQEYQKAENLCRELSREELGLPLGFGR